MSGQRMIKRMILFLLLLLTGQEVFSQGYYKDLFMDSGVYLISRQELDARLRLNLSMELIATEDAVLQNNVMVGDSIDENGVLLYPDGAPRFKIIYTNGSRSPVGPGAIEHGATLGEIGRNRIRQFYANGGSFTGSCLGAWIASRTFLPEYYGIWPGYCKPTTLDIGIRIGHFISPDSPLLRYFNFDNDHYISNIMHGGGPFADEANRFPVKTEALLRYDYPSIDIMHDKISCWAYKQNAQSGRIVVIGSHPEYDSWGEAFDLMTAILQYALDGIGSPQVKATLNNGELRVMDKETIDNAPDFTRIGDKQYHHYKIRILSCSDNLTVTLDGDDSQIFNLYLKKDAFAFRQTADFADTSRGSDKTIHLTDIAPGYWYIGVECDTTVEATYAGYGYSYSGNVAILNGAPYTIRAEWNDPNATIKTTRVSKPSLRANSDSLHLNVHLENPHLRPVQVHSYIINTDSIQTDSFPLYDDGFHGDSLAGDGLYGGVIGPVLFEDMFTAGITVKDMENNCENNFAVPDLLTSIGPLKLSHYQIVSADTIPNHGDRIRFEFTLNNEGLVSTATQISSQLTCLDTHATMPLLKPAFYGDIPSGNSITGDVGQNVKFNDKSPDQSRARFRLDILSNDHVFWSDTFSVNFSKVTNLQSDVEFHPTVFSLSQNYPNPFNPSTQIDIRLPKSEYVDLKIYNMLGQVVATLVDKRLAAGNHEITFKAEGLPSGIYFYRITAGEFQQVRKMMFLK